MRRGQFCLAGRNVMINCSKLMYKRRSTQLHEVYEQHVDHALHGPSFRARRVDCLMRYAAGPVVVSRPQTYKSPQSLRVFSSCSSFPFLSHIARQASQDFKKAEGRVSLYNGKHVPPANGMLLDTVKVYTKQIRNRQYLPHPPSDIIISYCIFAQSLLTV